jgi:REP element-mobilizing transposase RayT
MSRRKPRGEFSFPRQFQSRNDHGGDIDQGRRKLHRPLDPALHYHVVLRSGRARGERSFLHRRNRSRVERLIYSHALKQKVTVDRLANVGNHIHLLVRFPTPEAFRRFLKTIAGLIARQVTGARRGSPLKALDGVKRRFWDGLAYTRGVTWGRELRAVRAYLAKNRLEAIGFRGARLKIRAGSEAVVVVGELPADASIEGLPAETAKVLGAR